EVALYTGGCVGCDWRLVTKGQVAVVGAQVRQVSWSKRGDQLRAGLHLERLAAINLAHALQVLFRDRAREHPQGPREVWTIQTPQFIQPHPDRAHAPRHRPPPTVLPWPEIHLPALHH